MPACPHRWKIPSPPERPVGVCAHCGARKTFFNAPEAADRFDHPAGFGHRHPDFAPVNEVPLHLWSKDGRP